MQLFEPTASRKHALIFHHPNGSCYVVDCGSAHGTYVNGVRVGGPSVQEDGEEGTAVAVPHRVRKGSLVRFGGPTAPTFVLKCFSASLENLVRQLSGDATTAIPNSSRVGIVPVTKGSSSPTVSGKPTKGEMPSCLPTLSPTTPRPATPSPTKGKQTTGPYSPSTALVTINTRVNALGGGALISQRTRIIAKRAASKFVTASDELEQLDSCLLGKRFRAESDGELLLSPTRQHKRFRSASFPLSPDPAIHSCLKLHDVSSHLLQTPLVSQQSLASMEVEYLTRDEGRRRVKFQEGAEHFYPASVTPDVMPGSFDDEHIASLKM